MPVVAGLAQHVFIHCIVLLVAQCMDVEALSRDEAAMLLALLPSPEEVELVTTYEGDPAGLGSLEKFVLAIKDVPMLKRRLEAVAFRHRFDELEAETAEQLGRIDAALEVVDRCQELQSLLRFVLALGNYLNAGSNRGGAYGFKLGSLSKLATVRTCDNKSNLLEYVARCAVDTKAGLRAWGIFRVPERLDGVANAKDTSLNEIISDVRKFRAQFDALRAVAEAAADAVDGAASKDRLASVMGEFAASRAARADALEGKTEATKKRFNEMLAAYAEDPTQDTIAFFSQWAAFAASFKQALDKATRAQAAQAKTIKLTGGEAKPALAGGAAAGMAAAAGAGSGVSGKGRMAAGFSASSISKKLAQELQHRRRHKQDEEDEDGEDGEGLSETTIPLSRAREASSTSARRRSILQSDRWRKGRKSIVSRDGGQMAAMAAAIAVSRAGKS